MNEHPLRLDCGASQLRGARVEQQDYLALTRLGADRLVVIADGMGGHAGGAVAAECAVTRFVAACRSGAAQTGGVSDPAALLSAALNQANHAIAATVAERPELRGMGTTLIGALFGAGQLHWVSVGDSLLYRLRAGRLERLNADHSFGAALDVRAAHGEISVEQACNDPRRHQITSALVGSPIPLVDRSGSDRAVQGGDRFLLATDGIATLPRRELSALLQRADDAATAVVALSRAVSLAADPYQDNCSLAAVFAPTTGLAQRAADWWRERRTAQEGGTDG